ncbi:MAG: CRTAC1 family protein, partial [Microthrixaceae bacterium]|nr:CRTAC1 family protein [Microthrixaceae bacterium]
GVETVHTAHASSVLDVDGDGNLDWFLTGVSYPTASGECPIDDPRHDCAGNHLLLGNGDGTFRDATGEYGVAEGYWGQGSVAADLNSDGATDLMMTSGYRGVATARPDTGNDPQRPYFEHGVDDPDRLWLNTGAVRSAGLDPTDPATGSTPWPEASATVGLSSLAAGKAAVPLDYDGDGRIDLLVANTNGPPTLWRNTADNPNRWLAVQLHDRDSANTSGVGAVVSVSTADGFGQSQRIGTDGSFQSGTTARAHFGLGPAPGEVAVEIRWPDGSVTSSRVTELDRLVVFTRES